MALPMLVLPFITMIFWALGGGPGTPVQAHAPTSGLNMELPGAHFKKEDELWDKFKLYEQAKRDSARYEEARRNDPYYVTTTIQVKATDTLQPDSKLNTSLGSKDKYAPIEESEQMIHRKLELLTRQLNEPEPVQTPAETQSQVQQTVSVGSDPVSPDVARLEKMMQVMSGPEVNDPEMHQIEGMLEKILDIQHPERVREKIKAQSLDNSGRVFPVTAASPEDNISLVEGQAARTTESGMTDSLDFLLPQYPVQAIRNSFYGLDDEELTSQENPNAIEAVIHNTQTVVSGSTIKLRLLSDVYINGQLVEANSFIYGVCAINGERLAINITSIRNDHSLLPVALVVYDLDGLEGAYIPGAIARDVAKQAGSQSVQDLQMYSMDNSLGVQAAAAGVEAAKGIFSRKAKLIEVTVKAGYQVLLKDTNARNTPG